MSQYIYYPPQTPILNRRNASFLVLDGGVRRQKGGSLFVDLSGEEATVRWWLKIT